jgi:hypothetical protein
MVLHEYTYVFAIGTMFVLLEAYNNGASMFDPDPFPRLLTRHLHERSTWPTWRSLGGIGKKKK